MLGKALGISTEDCAEPLTVEEPLATEENTLLVIETSEEALDDSIEIDSCLWCFGDSGVDVGAVLSKWAFTGFPQSLEAQLES